MGAPFVWYDITATDDQVETIADFYADLLGWTINPDTGPGPYHGWIADDGGPWASIIQATGATARRWIPYIQVDDLDAAVDKATKLGARVLGEKTDGPAGTAIPVADPGGAVVALWVPFTADT